MIKKVLAVVAVLVTAVVVRRQMAAAKAERELWAEASDTVR